MAPGSSIITHNEQINKFITSVNPVIIAVNFIPDNYRIDFAFFSNNKRFSKISNVNCKTIVTSNIIEGQADFKVDYNSLSGAFDQGCNSFIMLLKFLKDMEVKSITAVGADGYSESDNNYYSSSIRSYTAHGNKFNLAVANAIRSLDISVDFLTPSAYDI